MKSCQRILKNIESEVISKNDILISIQNILWHLLELLSKYV